MIVNIYLSGDKQHQPMLNSSQVDDPQKMNDKENEVDEKLKITNVSFPRQFKDIEGQDVLDFTIHCGGQSTHAIIVNKEKLRANPADVFLEEILRVGNITNLGEAYRMFKEKVVNFFLKQ